MPSRQVYRRRRAVVISLLAVILVVAFYLPMTLLAPLHATTAMIDAPALAPGAAAAPAWPGYGASAIGVVGYPEATASSGRTDPVPMASITKLVTALVVLQAKPLAAGQEGPSITMTAADVALYRHYLSLDGEVATVKAGVAFSELDLLRLALIKSANNYAGSLAVWAFGSQDAYATAANAWLAQKQLTGIHIVEPTGIDPANVGTAADLVELGELALQNPVIAPIVQTKATTIHDVGDITNTNTLLGKEGIDGLKTGTLNGWGSNLLFASDRTIGGTTVTIVGAVLGGRTHAAVDADITTLLGTVVSGLHAVTLATTGESFGSYRTPWGDTAGAVAAKKATTVVWGDTAIRTAVATLPITTGAKGTSAGTVTFTAGTKRITVPLKLSAAIDDPGPAWRLGHPEIVFGAP